MIRRKGAVSTLQERISAGQDVASNQNIKREIVLVSRSHFFGLPFFKGQFTRLSAPWGRNPVSYLCSSVSCGGTELVAVGELCKCWSKWTKQLPLRPSASLHSPNGVKTIPWNEIANWILNSPAVNLPYCQHDQVHLWASHYKAFACSAPNNLMASLIPSSTMLRLTHCVPQECWALHK